MANNASTNSKLVWIIGVGAATAALVSWLLPKFTKPKVVPIAPAPTMTTPMPLPAVSPAAVKQSMGAVRDYNLSGLAIEELDDYPSTAGVMLSGV